jgi:multidrug efflux system outer membrane protein
MRRCASSLVLATALAAVLAGCTVVGPNYERPTVDSPPGWRIDYPQSAEVANTLWWRQFDDPVLDGLIEQALRENRDLRIAAARIDQFIGQLRTTRAQFYPQVGYGADAGTNRSSKVGVPALPPGGDPYYQLYNGALSASWQIDLFGRVQRQTEAVQAQIYASEQGRRGVVLSLTSAVAASYVTLRGLDRQLEIAVATAKNYAGTKEIFDKRFAGGVVSQVQVQQVMSQYQQALAAIPGLEQQVTEQENLISTLLGRNPGPIARGKRIDAFAVPAIPGALPSSLLERRPDILQAEQLLIAANANVGVAQSLYYPTISLTGVLGLSSAALGDFLSSAAATWGLAAGVTGPLFTFGAIEGQVQSAEAAQRAALATYQQVVLNAFAETNDALAGTAKKRVAAQAQTERVAALREYARLSKLKFDNGYADYLEVLYAENELFGAELAAVRSQIDSYTQLIGVYKAMGGGWVDEAARLAPAPQAGAGSASP